MAVAVAVWSATLEPGEPTELRPPSDLRITNAALSDELADAAGRTTIKLTYKLPIAHDESDEEEDEEDGDPAEIVTTVLCSLTPGKIEQTTVDLILESDEEYLFEVVGKNTVYLTGNYIDQTPPDQVPFNDESDDEDIEAAYDLRDVSSDVEVDPDEMDVLSDGERFEEIEDKLVEAAPKKDASKKRPRESEASEVEGVEALSKNQKKKLSKKLKGEGGKAVATDAEEPAAPKEGETKEKKKKEKKKEDGEKREKKVEEKTLSGGLKIADHKEGTGPQAKKGDMVSMRYVGKLLDGKIFDKNTKGAPFKFRLGKGEVISGWDQGIAGMQVGGERELVIPPALAYGKRKQPDIPANSTLKFDVKLLAIN